MNRQRDFLRTDNATWGTVAWALIQSEQYPEATAWTDAWREREGLSPHPLFCRAVALWSLDRIAEAAEVSRVALTLPADSTTALHHMWLAAAEVLDDLPAAAAERLAQVDRADLGEYYRALCAIVTPAAEHLSAATPVSYAELRRQIRETLSPYWNTFTHDRVLQRIYHRILRRTARARRHQLRAAWHAWRG